MVFAPKVEGALAAGVDYEIQAWVLLVQDLARLEDPGFFLVVHVGDVDEETDGVVGETGDVWGTELVGVFGFGQGWARTRRGERGWREGERHGLRGHRDRLEHHRVRQAPLQEGM